MYAYIYIYNVYISWCMIPIKYSAVLYIGRYSRNALYSIDNVYILSVCLFNR